MKKNYLFLCIIFLFGILCNAQIHIDCDGEPIYEPPEESMNCLTPLLCAPSQPQEYEMYLPNENTPVKTIRVRFILIHYSLQEPRNFQASNPEHMAFLLENINKVNHRYANFILTSDPDCFYEQPPCVPGANTNTIENHSKIQFELVETIEHINPYLWNGDNFSSCGAAWVYASNNANVGENNALNLYFIGSECMYTKAVLLEPTNCSPPSWIWNVACANTASFNLNNRARIMMGDTYSKFIAKHNGYFCDQYPECCPECPPSWMFYSRTIEHEIGHNLGLLDNCGHCYPSVMSTKICLFKYLFYICHQKRWQTTTKYH